MLKLHKKVYVHYSVLLIALCFALGADYNAVGFTLLAVLLHECGHLAILFICGGKPEKLVLHAFGISINADSHKLSSRKMLFTALGGPALSFTFAGLFHLLLSPFSTVNLFIGAVNLLPVLPLDGGRMLRIIFTKIFGRKASRLLMRSIGIAFGCAAVPLGLFLFIRSGFNISLLLLGFFVLGETINIPFAEPPTFSSYKAAVTDIYLIPQNMTLRDTADFLPSDGIGAVVDENGTVLSLVTSKGLYNRLAQSQNNR